MAVFPDKLHDIEFENVDERLTMLQEEPLKDSVSGSSIVILAGVDLYILLIGVKVNA